MVVSCSDWLSWSTHAAEEAKVVAVVLFIWGQLPRLCFKAMGITFLSNSGLCAK
jgi:hypothetical protein